MAADQLGDARPAEPKDRTDSDRFMQGRARLVNGRLVPARSAY